jgi:hypothetical protein
MREFAKVAPQFWTGGTGKLLREQGPEYLLVALYLITCPNANALGLYYLPLPTLCHETGVHMKMASKVLEKLSEVGFCRYDASSEFVLVSNMARFQIGERLAPGDKRRKWVQRELGIVKKSPLRAKFLELYSEPFQLHEMENSEGPSEGHPGENVKMRSETETETETETEIETETESGAGAPGPHGPRALSNYDRAKVVFDLWNDTVKRLPQASALTDKRTRACCARLKEYSLDELRSIFQRLDASDFAANSNWATFDWVIQNAENPVKVLEGKYDNNNALSHFGKGTPTQASQQAFDKVLQETIAGTNPKLVELEPPQ